MPCRRAADGRVSLRPLLPALMLAGGMAMAACSPPSAAPADPVPPPPEPSEVDPAPSASAAEPAAVTSEQEAMARLTAALTARGDGDLSCLSFMPETTMAAGPEAVQPAWQFAVREIHDPPCAGDPATAPLRARYRVGADGSLAEYDAAADVYRPLATTPD